MEVAVTAPLPGTALEALARTHTVRVRDDDNVLDPEALAAFIGDADAAVTLLADSVTALVLQRCQRLKVVANYAVGFNNVDLDMARSRGIWVTNTPDVLTDATADLAVALLLAVVRRLGEGERFFRAGRFKGWWPSLLLGAALQGRTLGIVGFGRIGQAVARRAEAFGMKVLFTTGASRPDDPRYRDLEDLLAASDVVSLHCPLTEHNRHMLDERRLRLMPRGAYLVNTARGPLVDEGAVARLLDEGHLAGAGFDVYELEPEVHPALLGRDDVVLLPHLGSATVEARTAMANLAVANVAAVLAGREPPTPVVRGSKQLKTTG